MWPVFRIGCLVKKDAFIDEDVGRQAEILFEKAKPVIDAFKWIDKNAPKRTPKRKRKHR